MRCIARIQQSHAPECGKTTLPSTRFCAEHAVAPKWQRAAWASAYARKEKLATPVIDTDAHEVYDASNIAPRLWVGAKPPLDRSYPGIDMIVLCAAEYQPRAFPYFQSQILHCPLPDDALSHAERTRALTAANAVAKYLRDGKRVLVTCQQGRNRSAFVAALALGILTRATPDQIIQRIREKRLPTCLTNPHFCEYLRTYGKNQPRS